MGCHSTAVLTAKQVNQAAKALYDAEVSNEPTTPTSERFPDADIEDAYRISQAVTELKLKAGRTIKGHKIGLTSKAMRSLTGATEPDYGTMFDNWFVLEGSTVPRSRMNRPLVEVEIAFVLSAPLLGPRVNAADVIRATDFVLPCIEIVDTRQKGRGPNSLVDSISDAAACGLVVLGGRPVKLTDVDIRRIGASLVDQRQRRGERRRASRHGQPDQRGRLARQQAARVRRRRSKPATSSCRARSSRRSRSSPATRSWRCSTRSAKSRSTPSSVAMRYGVTFSHPDMGDDPGFLKEFARSVEGAGFDHLLAAEHVIGGHPDRLTGEKVHTYDVPYHEPFVLFGYLGAVTERIELVTGILILPAAPDGAGGQAGGRARPADRRPPRLGVGVGPQLDGVRGAERGLHQPRRAPRGAGRGAAAAVDRGARHLRRRSGTTSTASGSTRCPCSGPSRSGWARSSARSSRR